MAQLNQSVTDVTSTVRNELITLLTGRKAHQAFDDAINDIPTELFTDHTTNDVGEISIIRQLLDVWIS